MNSQVTYFEIASGKIDRRKGVIKGCAVITVGEAKGHRMRVDMTTLEQVRDCAEEYVGGVAVRFAQEDHGGGAANIIGNLRNWRVEDETLRADLHLLKAHQDYELVMEMAATMPESFGLSIVFSGVHEDTEAGLFARCIELYGVDVVKNPAANPTGLFTANPVDTVTIGEHMKKSLQEQLTETTELVATITKERDEARTDSANHAEKISGLQSELQSAQDALKAEQEARVKDVDALQSSATEINALKAAQADFDAKVAAKVQEQMAAIGAPAVDKADSTPAKPEQFTSKADAVKELERLSKEDRAKAREFYLKHKTIINS